MLTRQLGKKLASVGCWVSTYLPSMVELVDLSSMQQLWWKKCKGCRLIIYISFYYKGLWAIQGICRSWCTCFPPTLRCYHAICKQVWEPRTEGEIHPWNDVWWHHFVHCNDRTRRRKVIIPVIFLTACKFYPRTKQCDCSSPCFTAICKGSKRLLERMDLTGFSTAPKCGYQTAGWLMS